MNNKIKQYSALALAVTSVFPLSCGKDATEKNDDNIDDKIVNIVLNTVATGTEFSKEDSIDINDDGQFDFTLFVGGEVNGTYSNGYCSAIGKNPLNQIISSDITVGAYSLEVATAKNSGDKINASSVDWENKSYFSYKENSSSTGSAGAGDKLYGFKFKAGTNTHYGWMKVNVASDYKTLTVKELAFNKTPDAEIEVGAK